MSVAEIAVAITAEETGSEPDIELVDNLRSDSVILVVVLCANISLARGEHRLRTRTDC